LLPGLAVLALATAVRLPGLAGLSLETDELGTIWDATRLAGPSVNGPGILARPVYYVLQHLLLSLGPASPLALRIPALVFGLVGVWATWWVGTRLFGGAAGTVAALLVALSPWHQYASQFARYWTLVYLLAVLGYYLLIRTRIDPRPRTLVLTALVLALGALTHPTFVLPMVGAVLALHILPPATPGDAWRLRLPTADAWRWLWIPLVVAVGGWIVGLKLTGNAGALGNFRGRGLAATIGAVLGMVQWVTPEVLAAGALGAALLVWRGVDGDERRWGLMALGGLASGGVLIVASGIRNDVYADYGMAMLPLVYLTAGALVGRMVRMPSPASPAIAGIAVVTLLVAELPGLASNWRDGMRFDYRPAFAYVEAHGAQRLVLGPSQAMQRHYAPTLQFQELGGTTESLAGALVRTGGYWLIISRHRNGWSGGDEDMRSWADANCRVMSRSGAARFDYRQYDVDLAWCGSGAP
jgi:hypothetical protein